MWNYSYVIPSLLVLAVFVGYYFSLPRIPVRLNVTYLALIGVECLVMSTDIISSWADSNYQLFPVWLLYFLNSLYFIAFFARAYCFYIITASAIRLGEVIKTRNRRILALPVLISILIVLATPFTKWFYYIDDTGYHSAPLYNLLYVVFWFYLLHSFMGIASHKENLRRKRELLSTFWYNVILLAGTIIRLMFPRYLLMDTFCLLAIIIIYLSFQNPDFYMEERTWVFNRKALRDYLQEINERKKFVIFAFTIHNYNDMRQIYGIKQMDQGVGLIADFLRKSFPKDKIFYYRNGRFVILFEDAIDDKVICQQIHDRFQDPWKADNTELYVDIGCAVMDMSVQKVQFENLMILLEAAFAEADMAEKYEIRRIGAAHAKKAQEETEIKKSIEYAIDNDTIEVFLQPIVDSHTGTIVGAEALSRLRDEKGDLIPPGLFIPIAEHNGRINLLGKQMFIKTCDFISKNDMKKMGLSWINVNLSPIQFMRPNLGTDIVDTLKKYGIDHEFIHLEITEEAMVDEQLLINQTKNIKKLGFNFVLDDYGKGYSNITRLRQCPFVNIKLDMSIVWDYCANPDMMLPSMVKTFSQMGFQITAEGIEDEYMAQKMAEIGCNYLQGFHYDKALPLDEFVKKYGTA